MATSRSGAGGKIVTNRRKQRLSATPYDRPPPPTAPNPTPKSPNWLAGLVIPSARAFASGAGKILSYLISDSDSSSSEDGDSASEDDAYADDDNEIPNHGVNELSENNNMVSSGMVHYGVESRLNVQQPETKRLIEQLIMQETFSREECDRLIEVLNSRVIDWPMQAGEKSLLAGSPGKISDHGDIDIYDKAVLEAKKWFQEKKVGLSSATELTRGTFNLNPPDLRHVESGSGSPVDVAKSYMRDRPPWASPTNHVELRTPLTTTMKLFKEGTSYSVGHDSFSLSKKRSSLASGSWNIQEELRRVRSKATEDMLRNSPTKIDPSWFATGPLSVMKTIPSSSLVDAGVSSDPALAELESRHDGKASEVLSSRGRTSVSGNNEDSQVVQMDNKFASTALNASVPGHSEGQQTDPDKKVNGPPTIVATETGGKQTVNGFPSSRASLSAGETAQLNHEEENGDDHDSDALSGNKYENISSEKENCQLLMEAVEVPIVTETNSIASGSQNSLGLYGEELSLDTTQPSLKGTIDVATGKQQGRKSGKYNRRGRGRGK